MIDQNSQFYAILTNVGVAKQANADALGIPFKFTHMGVGDANGTEPQPDANQKALINEWRRAPLNQLKQDTNNPAVIIAEQVIPADVGGKWIREIGLYDADGDLVAVANCAPSFKPLLNQGSGRTQVVRMNLIVSNSANVELKIDPSVVLATREFVLSELAKQDFKNSVLVCAPGSIVLNGLQTIDGVSVPAGKRVLAPFQTAAKDRGIWVSAAGAWARATDADANDEVTPGMLVLVEQGTLYGDSAWQLVTDAPITLGVSSLTFEMAWGRTGIAPGEYRSVVVDKLGRVVSASNPTTAAGYGLTDVYTKTQVDTLLAAKAPLVSPVLTGIPKAPTPGSSTNSDQIATTAFVQALFTALVGAAPETLNQINEIAAALGNDPNFSTTIMNALALRAPLASPVFTGDPKAPTPALGDNDTSIATTAFVAAAITAASRSYSASVTNVNTNRTLTVAEVGQGFRLTPSTPIVITMPDPQPTTGLGYVLRNEGTANVTVSAAGFIYTEAGAAAKTLVLAPGEWVEIISNLSSWVVYMRGKLGEVAKVDSPVFTGDPRAPTPAVGDNDTSIATTAFVQAALALFGVGAVNGPRVTDLDALAYGGMYFATSTAAGMPIAANSALIHVPYSDGSAALQICCALSAPTRIYYRTRSSGTWNGWKEFGMLDSPVFTGDPRAPTQSVGDNDTSIATTAFVQAALAAFGIGTFIGTQTADLNTAVQGGCYRTTNTTANSPVAGNMSVWVVPYNNGGCLQVASLLSGATASAKLYYRTQAGGSWSGWKDVLSSDSPALLGTPTTTTPAANDVSKQIVNTEFFKSELARLKSVVKFTANGNWTCPDGVTTVWISGCGGGGGGGGGGGLSSNGAGGGGGGAAGRSVIREPIAVTPGTTYAITIGAGGAAGASAASGTAGKSGANGGTTSFGSLLNLSGGGAGTGGDIASGAGGYSSAAGGGGGSDGGDAQGQYLGGDGGSGGGGPFGTSGGGGRAGQGGGRTAIAATGNGVGGGGGGAGYSPAATGTATGGAGGAGMPGVLTVEY